MAVCSRWGVWEEAEEDKSSVAQDGDSGVGDGARSRFRARFCLKGVEVSDSFGTRGEALAYQSEQLEEKLGWPRQPLALEIERDPLWDHPEELESKKEYSFREPPDVQSGPAMQQPSCVAALSVAQLQDFEARGFLMGLPVLSAQELQQVQRDFETLLASRVARCSTEDARHRAAHTLSRPLHQDLVAQLAQHAQVLRLVEAILGPRFVCWSAHLFCKLPGDPTQQPWHQDAGFWPLSASRALTLWLAFDDVDASNAAVTFIEGSHKLGRLPWQRTSSTHHLLTQEIPDVDLIGRQAPTQLRAGEASVHCDLTVHGSTGNSSMRRRAGLALRYVATDASCLGPMLNGYRMNMGCILPKGKASDPRGHWKALRRRPGGVRAARTAPGGDQREGEKKLQEELELRAEAAWVAAIPGERISSSVKGDALHDLSAVC